MQYFVHESDVKWQAHPGFEGVKIKILQSWREQGALATIVITQVPKCIEVPWHIHENSDDILFILRGKATISLDGIGTYNLEEGSCIRVPKATKHKIHDVVEDLIIYDVFAPPTI